MTNKVIVSNLRIHGFHGVKVAEKSLGQKFEVDIVCDLPPHDGFVDDMENTVCYNEVCDLVCRVSQGEVFNLIETLADRIAARIFDTFPLVEAVAIEIRKPSAPIAHIVNHVAVAITRRRND